MTRRMADSITVANLPDGFDLYGVYDDGLYNNIAAASARFGPNKIVAITVFARDNFGVVLDVENGDATPAQAPGWVQARRAAGADPTVYCSEALWPTVIQAFTDAKVPAPHWWIAGYPGSVGDALYPGSVAHQWIDRGPYDESVVADYWPGVDPAPQPAPQPGDPVAQTEVVSFKPGQLDVFQVAIGELWHKWAIAGKWTNEIITLPDGFGPLVGVPEVSVVGGACYVSVENAAGKVGIFVQAQDASSWANQVLP